MNDELFVELNGDIICLVLLCAKAATALVRLSHRNSVRLSVRLSDRHTDGSVKKQCKLETPNFYHWLPGILWFQVTPNEGLK